MSPKIPNSKKCPACSQVIGTPEQLKCITCDLRYHFECINSSKEKFNVLTTEYKTKWVCPSCRSKQPKGDNSNTPVRGISSSPLDAGSVSYVTHRRTQPLIQSQDSLTFDSVKQLMQEEMKVLLSNIEKNISKIIEKKIGEMSKEINEIKESVCFISNQYEDFKKDFHGKVMQVNDLRQENENLKSTVTNLTSRLNIIEQHSRICNLEIQCLPEHKAENLPNIISQIGKATGSRISDADIHKCTRIAKLNPENERPRSVIVKFSSPRTRDAFLAGVIKFNRSHNNDDKLNTSLIGIGGKKKPIYVVEHLTPELKKIHALARLTAKKLKYRFVWTNNGRVFMRKTEGSEHIVVRNIEQLQKLTS